MLAKEAIIVILLPGPALNVKRNSLLVFNTTLVASRKANALVGSSAGGKSFESGSMTTVRTLFKPMLKAHAHSAHVHVTFDASNIPALSSSCADENDFFSSVSAASSDAASASGQKMSKKPRKKARARTHADLCTTPLPAPSDEIHQTCQSGTKRASERGMRN